MNTMNALKTRSTQTANSVEQPPSDRRSVEQPPPAVESTDAQVADLLDSLTGGEIETVIGGALQRVHYGPGVNPATLPARIRLLDPTAQFRTEFPSKSFGKRDSKTATALTVNVESDLYGVSVSLLVHPADGGKDMTLKSTKKKSAEIASAIVALGKLSDDHAEEIKQALESKGSASFILALEERFGASYWTTDDGKDFLESVTPEPPAPSA